MSQSKPNTPSHATCQKIASVKRLLRDLREVLAEPLPNIAARPLQDNLFLWHGNVQGSEGPFCGVPIHFTLEFPENYPEIAPQCRLATGVPHPNVRSIGAGYRLALWDCIPGQDAWSSAYTVQSILIQLQQFLLADELQYNDMLITMDNAVKQAMQLNIPAVNHKGTQPWPAFPTEEDLKNSEYTRKVMTLGLPMPSKQKKIKSTNTANNTNSKVLSKILDKKQSDSESLVENSLTHTLQKSTGDAQQNTEPEWITVTGKKGKKISTNTPNTFQTNEVAVLKTSNVFQELKNIKEPKPQVQKPKLNQRLMELSTTSKAAKRNQRRTRKRQQKDNLDNIENQASSSSSSSPTPEAISNSTNTPTPTPTPNASAYSDVNQGFIQVKSKSKYPLMNQAPVAGQEILQQSFKDLISSVYQQFENKELKQNDENLVLDDQFPDIPSQQQHAMGLFGILPAQTIFQITCQLQLKDIQSLSSTCKGLNKVAESGEVWQQLLQNHYPGTRLSATHISQCKHMFMLELNNIVGEMTCFYTKRGIDDENVVLGLPYRFTVNPKTEKIDYIEVDPELLSLDAFHYCGVRKNIQGEKIQGVLPLYLTEEHFQRAFKYFPLILRQLVPEQCERGNTPKPNAWLQVIPKIMNTNAVLLCDKGIKVTEKSLIIYSQLQRLLIAICERYNLWGQIDQILFKAIKTEEGRHKNELPNMGNIFPLIGVSRKFSWRHCAKQFVRESFDRAVMWICKNDEDLIGKFKVSPQNNNDVDEELNKGAFNASLVARRLMMFQVAFLQFVAKPINFSPEEIIDRLDSLYGRPSRLQIKQFNWAVKCILNVDNFPKFFKLIGMKDCGPKELTRWLRQSWENSLNKKYHQKNMDFSRIQKSGVSKILLKGETYTAPPNMKQISMEEHWSWEGGHCKFLDASCLLYSNQGKFIEAVDFNNLQAFKIHPNDAVCHSGDIMQEQSGKHIIDIYLTKLPVHVTKMYITMSSYMGAKLSNIKQPFVSLVDPDTNVSLCDYHLEDLDAGIANQYSCVVMCKIYLGKNKSWNVQALGKICQGWAQNYGSILQTIEELERTDEK